MISQLISIISNMIITEIYITVINKKKLRNTIIEIFSLLQSRKNNQH